MYVLVNRHTLWRNSPNLMCNVTRENISQSEFRFVVIRIWYAMFRRTNGRMEVLHYPVNKQTHHRRSLAMTVTSPRKGTHNIQRISSEDCSSKDQIYMWQENIIQMQQVFKPWGPFGHLLSRHRSTVLESISYHSRI